MLMKSCIFQQASGYTTMHHFRDPKNTPSMIPRSPWWYHFWFWLSISGYFRLNILCGNISNIPYLIHLVERSMKRCSKDVEIINSTEFISQWVNSSQVGKEHTGDNMQKCVYVGFLKCRRNITVPSTYFNHIYTIIIFLWILPPIER